MASGGPPAKRSRTDDGLADPGLDLEDPNPDIWELFNSYNFQFFENRLSAVTVEWSKRLTSCAGICYYKGKYGGCQIRMSVPLLSFRPRSDTVNTLIHEMIHAYLFVTQGNMERDQDGHGPQFQQIMRTINAAAGTNITVYHTFHDEVNYHKKHWWRCDGDCRTSAPYYGYVKRAMNRAPGPSDRWWPDHKQRCRGSFIKIKEPEKPAKPEKKVKQSNGKNKGTEKPATASSSGSKSVSSPAGGGHRLGGTGQNKTLLDYFLSKNKISDKSQ